jgi:predicted aminopeptidase
MRASCLTLLFVSCFGVSGCYYGHLASGQLKILWNRQPIEEARVDPAHPEEVRAMLGLVESVRVFALELGLRVEDQYTSYVDWPDDRIVTTLVRTRVGELKAEPWWFPILGHLPYKGYFDRDRAETEAARIRDEGEYELCVSGVTAYSTLGWLDDPVTRPMLRRGAAPLVETLFHELVHATAFLKGEADFNEGVAQFIGQQAAIQFFAARERDITVTPSPWPSESRVRASITDQGLIASTTLAFRDRLETLSGLPDRPERRIVAEAEARAELAALPLQVYDSERVAAAARLSDACLALRGTYIRDLPRHAELLDALGGDLTVLITRLGTWADEERPSEAFFEVESAARESASPLSLSLDVRPGSSS